MSLLAKPKPKPKELTVAEVKKMIYKEIQKKQEQIYPEKFNIRIVEDNLAEV
jgi:hypothetical protein